MTFLLGFFVDFHVAVEYTFVFLNSIQVTFVTQSMDIVVVMVAFRLRKMDEEQNKGNKAIEHQRCSKFICHKCR